MKTYSGSLFSLAYILSGLFGFCCLSLTGAPSMKLTPVPQGQWRIHHTAGFAQNVAIAGDRAYVPVFDNGLAIFHIHDPVAPQLLGVCDTTGFAVDVAVMGSYALVADWQSGMQVIDLSNPANPRVVGSYRPTLPSAATGVAALGSYVILAASGLVVLDMSDPTRPQKVSAIDNISASEVTLAENIAFVAAGDAGVKIIDINDPTNPQLLTSFETIGRVHDVAISGTKLYAAAGFGGLQIFDVSSLGEPKWRGSYKTSGAQEGAVGVAVLGSHAFVADGAGGMHVIDVSNPVDPKPSGNFFASGSVRGVCAADNRIYVADSNFGLIILSSVPNVMYTLRVEGPSNVSFMIEAASTLSPLVRWAPIFGTNFGSSPFFYVDTNVKVSDWSQKYYRLR